MCNYLTLLYHIEENTKNKNIIPSTINNTNVLIFAALESSHICNTMSCIANGFSIEIG